MRAGNARIMNQAFGPGMLDDRPLAQAAARRAHVAVAGVLESGSPRSPAGAAMRRARLGCDAIEGMMRGALSDPDKLVDPAWIEDVVRIAVEALTAPLPR